MTKNNPEKPLLMFHGNSKKHGKPNSVEAIRDALAYQPDIIEVDVRKSKDGILYCYHGLRPLAFILKFFKYKTIKTILSVNSLSEIIIEAKDVIIFLDIKEKSISADDISNECAKTKNEIWLAAHSLKLLQELKQKLGNKYRYIYNFSFLFFGQGLKKAEKADIDAFKVFWWQCNEVNTKRTRSAGMSFVIHPWLMSLNKYKKLLAQYGSLWVAVDDMKRPEKLLMKI